VVAAAEVQQCYRVGSGRTRLSSRADLAGISLRPPGADGAGQLRYVRSFFAVKRSKFEPTIPL